MTTGEVSVFIEAPEEMRDCVTAAALRASYLYPGYEIVASANGLCAGGVPPQEAQSVRRDLRYILYREHIRRGFADYRSKALDRVYGGAA